MALESSDRPVMLSIPVTAMRDTTVPETPLLCTTAVNLAVRHIYVQCAVYTCHVYTCGAESTICIYRKYHGLQRVQIAAT